MSEVNSENQVLVVDDSRVIRRAAVKILQKEYDVVEAEDGEDAWEELQNNQKISVVFSDLGMPNMDGFELLEKIRSADDPIISKIPVVIITGAEETDGTKEEVLRLGATDFITKPFDSITLKSRAAAHINYRNEVKSLEKEVAVDKLTGLYNENTFTQQGEQILAYAKRHSAAITLVRFDIDHFPDVFVKHGKAVAEQILKKVSIFIKEAIRAEDIAGRIGVSKFVLILSGSDMDGANLVRKRICEQVARLKLKMGESVFQIKFNAGVTSPSLNDTDIEFSELMSQAESALKAAEKTGGGTIVSYQNSDSKKTTKVADAESGSSSELDLNELMKQLVQGDSHPADEQLNRAMKKILPLIEAADKRFKLGLSKVIPHLKNKL